MILEQRSRKLAWPIPTDPTGFSGPSVNRNNGVYDWYAGGSARSVRRASAGMNRGGQEAVCGLWRDSLKVCHIDLVSSDGTRIGEHLRPQKKMARFSEREKDIFYGRATDYRWTTPSPVASPEAEIEEEDTPGPEFRPEADDYLLPDPLSWPEGW
eukprot:scaffold632138_cov29-Prasinocladus_malaysianus.AAC.2